MLFGSTPHPADNITEKAGCDILSDADPLVLKLVNKPLSREAVFFRMIQEGSIGPPVQRMQGDFLEEELTSRSQYPTDFFDRPSPVWNVMNDRKIEDCIERRVVGLNRCRVSYKQFQFI